MTKGDSPQRRKSNRAAELPGREHLSSLIGTDKDGRKRAAVCGKVESSTARLLALSRFGVLSILVDIVTMAERTGKFLVYGHLSGGHSDDKGRSARCGEKSNTMA
jgi:hypothetical protein